eukprot:CAMPEP_0194027810 /NCGR_PEP_ID=MMETSP0009_2-20130614/1867_1 /TAXON_ID=210454 /ORGANISM="Grammatophora oceanica, Strain CCMP 410" /LENGTH=45 /DNA_ID= /DNA_START= /DNA_END= /DNA_ORIENTATION=
MKEKEEDFLYLGRYERVRVFSYTGHHHNDDDENSRKKKKKKKKKT